MRDYVRLFLDSDDTELPDSLLDVWRDEATDRIQRTFEPWSFYQSTWTLVTTTHSNLLATDVESVDSIEGSTFVLKYLPHEAAVAMYAWGSDTSGKVYQWSQWGGIIYLWPTPASEETFTVSGIRKPTPATNATDIVDLPNEFHPIVCEWMIAKGLEQLDDIESAAEHKNNFREEVDGYRRRYLRSPSSGVQAVGELSPQDSYNYYGMWPPRLRFDFEQ